MPSGSVPVGATSANTAGCSTAVLPDSLESNRPSSTRSGMHRRPACEGRPFAFGGAPCAQNDSWKLHDMEDSGRFAGMGDSRKVRDMDDSRSGSEVQKR